MISRAQIIEQYIKLQQKHESEYSKLSTQANRISLLRLVVVLASLVCFYFFVEENNRYYLAGFGAGAALFFVLMKIHQKISWKRLLSKNMIAINRDEIAYLQSGALPFKDGIAYNDTSHAYASDLDLFGRKSLFQHVNRTATYMGERVLANSMLNALPVDAIKLNQDAVAELSSNIDTRQELYALGKITNDSKEIYERLIHWSETKSQGISKPIIILACLLTAALVVPLVTYFVTGDNMWRDIAGRVFAINLLLFFTQMKKVKQALFAGEKIDETLQAYALMLNRIAALEFQSEKLKALQLKLTERQAGKQIQVLSKIYAGMENVGNPFAAVIMNGLYFYHLHQLNKLNKWKQQFAETIPIWLAVIGEIEMLNSLANLHYNNPAFAFPQLNQQEVISFQDIGHPLIHEDKRVCSDVSFEQHRFVILTGSNMSGKSTFLRTLGINMVLAGMGGPVCAKAALVHPMPMFVSMRQSDSLADSESYFFAEVKRLQYVMHQLDSNTCFVLLDEILRGTNSDDKRSGTVGVIENIIKRNAIGAIATHDLEVCLTTEQHPETLTNKCFEVEIVNDELVFDYKLRPGICKNKSATFLMKKMGII